MERANERDRCSCRHSASYILNTDQCAAELGNIGLKGKVVGQWTEDIVRGTILYISLKPCGNSKRRSDQKNDEEGRGLENEWKVHGDTALQRKE